MMESADANPTPNCEMEHTRGSSVVEVARTVQAISFPQIPI